MSGWPNWRQSVCARMLHSLRANGQYLNLALQLPFSEISESMGNHDSKIVGAGSVD
jgi:hypothetical protein